MKKFLFLIGLTLLNPCFSTEISYSEPEPSAKPSLWNRIQSNFKETWDSQRYDLYIPLRVWHNRHYYSREKIDGFNEEPWGIGLGKVRDDGDWTHSLFWMTFADSHNDPETHISYALQRNWAVYGEHKVSLGAFAGLASRSDIMNYIPFPVAWPYLSYSYKRFSLQGMYFPGSGGNGNIAFFWARYRFN